ncbi:MAG: FAD-binding oxidoreductase [Woeseiaceae bacterium]|nr:FAD-binding oxidoreductase [Woeseiaceae bacterium]
MGAGFTGLSAGLALAERGYDVRILEANRVGWGASGRNGGQMIGGLSGERRLARALGPDGDRQLWDLRWAGHELIRTRIKRYDIRCDLKTGYADVAIKPRHLRELQESHDYLQRHDPPFEFRLLGRDETRDTIGSQAFTGALVNMGNGHLHPLNLCLGEADAAVQQGATIHEGSPVTGIRHGDKPKVETKHGSVTADFVILAGNAYHAVAKRLRDVMLPVNSYIIATAPLLPQQIATVNPLDLAICNPNFVIEYFRLSADKRMLFGGRCNYTGDDPRVITDELQPRMLRVFPQLDGLPIEFAWGGRMGIPLNRVPQFGRLAPNVFYAQGYSGHGVNVTHLAGEILADVVAGTSERFDVFARLRTWRIPGAHLFPTPLVKLGIAYYQLRDWL